MYGPNYAKLYDMVARFLYQSPNRKLKLHILSKLLVLAERTAIRETSTPIIGAEFYNAPKGPEFTELVEYICTTFPCTWKDQEDFETYTISLPTYYGLKGELSDFETEVVGRVWASFGGIQKWDLTTLRCTFPEWESPRVLVPLGVVLKKGLGYSGVEARKKLLEIEYYQGLKSADYS